MKMESSPFIGVGFIGMLQLMLITLKLCDVIRWPWVVTLLPLEMEVALILASSLMITVMYVVTECMDIYRGGRK